MIDNISGIIMCALVLFGTFVILAYQLGKVEGRAEERDKFERIQRYRGLANYDGKQGRRRTW
jgi:hypothetical protein